MAVKWGWRAGVFFVITVCVGLLSWVAFDLQRARERELQSAEVLGGTLTKLLEGHFLGSARQADHLLTDFANRFQSAVVERRPCSEVEAQLRHYAAQFPEAQSFRVADAQGRYLYTTPRASCRRPTWQTVTISSACATTVGLGWWCRSPWCHVSAARWWWCLPAGWKTATGALPGWC